MPPVIDAEELKLADTHGGGPRDLGPDDSGGGGDDEGSGDPNYVPGAGLLAMRFVLVSVSVLFITVGIAYYERSRAPENWQHIRVPHMLWLSTAIILASGWVIEAARSAFNRRDYERYVHRLEITVGGGLAFLASQVLALRELVSQGIYLQHNPHSSLFYVLTGAHGLHLLGGIAALCYLLLRASRMPERSRFQFQRQRSRTAVIALYWHFLTVLWVALFLGLLLWP
ncbi:MAG: cytochrome c oxidase subunit 3 [Acidobacteriia bacterium]|nr:cytochrome c oxidase subunit 3 [Terriglobia bacterium]